MDIRGGAWLTPPPRNLFPLSAAVHGVPVRCLRRGGQGVRLKARSSARSQVTFPPMSADVIVGDHGRRQQVAGGLTFGLAAFGCGAYRDLRGRPAIMQRGRHKEARRRADGSGLLPALAQTSEPPVVSGPAGPWRGGRGLALACVAPCSGEGHSRTPSPCRRSKARCAPGGGPPDQSPS